MSMFSKKIAFGFVLTVAGIAAAWGYYSSHRNVAPVYQLEAVAAPAESAAPVLPDISGFTVEAVRKQIPALHPGQIKVATMEDAQYFDYMSMSTMIGFFSEQQKTDQPVVIEVLDGVNDLASIAHTLNNENLIKKVADAWVLRVPLFIHPGATVVIQGKANALKMVTETASFISNFGNLYIVDTAVTGWREERNAPATFTQKDEFRPFISTWSASKTFLAATQFTHMGYHLPKSYGISFSSNAPLLRKDPAVARPTGWIVGCKFEDLYYGFYSYEADDVALIGNEYVDNVIYGIDPHDRSRRLIIARNNTHGAHYKHGIIVSREVNDSWIFDNHSYDNHGSGIMIDRNSRNNIVANNLSENNGADGLVFFESPDNISWNNRLVGNARSGLRVRNSMNIQSVGDKITNNAQYGFVSYVASLEAQATRNTQLDHYEMHSSFSALRTEMSGNKLAQFSIVSTDSLSLSGLRLFNSPFMFKGDLENMEAQIYGPATTSGQMARLTMSPVNGAEAPTVTPASAPAGTEDDATDANDAPDDGADTPDDDKAE